MIWVNGAGVCPARHCRAAAMTKLSGAMHSVSLPLCGIGEEELREGALRYTRDPAEAVAAVREGRAGLAFLTLPCTGAEILEVAGAGETMPQKSTYFYPKVPTGLVLSPL